MSTAAKTLTNTTSSTIIREAEKSELVSRGQLTSGKLYFWYYDAKTKDRLPYWDVFPCAFIVDKAPGGFYGLNLHYLPYGPRAALMDALYELENSSKYTANKKLQLSYGILKDATKLSAFKPCFKRYLWSHTRSKFFKIDYSAWNIAAFLPVSDFQKASEATVWADSRRIIGG